MANDTQPSPIGDLDDQHSTATIKSTSSAPLDRSTRPCYLRSRRIRRIGRSIIAHNFYLCKTSTWPAFHHLRAKDASDNTVSVSQITLSLLTCNRMAIRYCGSFCHTVVGRNRFGASPMFILLSSPPTVKSLFWSLLGPGI